MITRDKLAEILENHKKWFNNEDGGVRADLRGADLRGADLYRADLCGADLCGADLYRADLCGANLCRADLRGANLYGANLREANLREADLYGANLREANLCGANLREANLYGTNLYRANLCEANLYGTNLYRANLREANLYGTNLCEANLYGSKNTPYIPIACPDTGAFVGWKKVRSNYIVKLLIPEDAKRSSSTGRKCRTNKADVLSIENVDGSIPPELNVVSSLYDEDFKYRIGETVTVDNFCDDRFKECAPGIHFFINRQEAVDYHG